jgi:periplasmic divalent cation tolerance protein
MGSVPVSTIAIVTTTDSLEEARSIAAALVERKLAACAQISSIESYYTWQGTVQNDEEFRVLVKTTNDRYADVEALPAIIAFDSDHVYEPYADWVADAVSNNNS